MTGRTLGLIVAALAIAFVVWVGMGPKPHAAEPATVCMSEEQVFAVLTEVGEAAGRGLFFQPQTNVVTGETRLVTRFEGDTVVVFYYFRAGCLDHVDIVGPTAVPAKPPTDPAPTPALRPPDART